MLLECFQSKYSSRFITSKGSLLTKSYKCLQALSQIVFLHLDEESYMFERRPQLLHRLQVYLWKYYCSIDLPNFLGLFCLYVSFIKVFLGGRAAEEVIYGRDTSKASLKYLQDATCLARKMLTM